MKKKIIKKIVHTRSVISLLVVSVLSFAVIATQASAANASLSLTPSSSNVQQNANFAVSIYEDSGAESVNAIKVILDYDQSKTEFVSIDISGGAFDYCADKAGGSGKVSLVCTKLGSSFTGRQLIAKINFKALAGSGSSALTFDSTSVIASSGSGGNLWNGVVSAGTVNFTTPPSNTGGNQGGSGGGSNSGGGNSNSGGSNNAGGNRGGGSNTGGNQGGSGGGNSGSNNSGGGSAPVAQPPADYDDGGNTVVGSEELNSVVAIRILDEKGQPAVGIKVTINRQTVVTDDTGVASFVGIKPGKYKVQAKGVLGAATKNITIAEDSNVAAVPQTFELQLKKGIDLATYGIIAAAVILIVIFALLVRRWKNNRPLRPSGPSRNSVIINGGGASDTAPSLSSSMPTVLTGASTTHVESPQAGKDSVNPADTLDQIEKKVGANKQAAASHDSNAAQSLTNGPLGGQVIRPTQPPSDPV